MTYIKEMHVVALSLASWEQVDSTETQRGMVRSIDTPYYTTFCDMHMFADCPP